VNAEENLDTYTAAAFYRFTPVSDPAGKRLALKETLTNLMLYGTLVIAPEGINGTLAGTESAVDALAEILEAEFGLPRMDIKFSWASERPFPQLKVRVKKEVITFGQPLAAQAGQYVAPCDWNELIADPDVLVLDTRNRYETRIGSFSGALDPKIGQFSEFAAYARQALDPVRHPKIAMFCTGGIRCEKASAFLLSEGFGEVYHLKGGILKYLEAVPTEDSRWQGECYVFDHRMSVGADLSAGRYRMCYCCGEAVSERDQTHALYEEGVACPLCFARTSDADKARYRMRQKQMMRDKL